MTRLFYDLWGKRFWSAVVDEEDLELEAPVSSESMRIDMVVRRRRPLPEGAAEVLGEALPMVEGVSCIELLSESPGAEDVARCRRKHLLLRALALTAPWPHRWMLCAGRPHTVLADPAWRRLDGAPDGFYALQTAEPVRIVVLSELPPGTRTLFLRLMAKGNTLINALDDLHDLPDDALVRQVALPILVAFRADLLSRRLIADEPRHQDTENLMNILARGQKLLDDMTTKAHADGAADGEALTLGRGLSRRLGRPLGEVEQRALRAWIASTGIEQATDEVFDLHDATEAEQWLERLLAD